ncbi:MAG: OmpH family outer membrane protein [Candidatus Omnitrophica bacterium]|nr:OmpH family outer membrane protein [Candidatus Omnitrophota bacterium]
MKRIVIAVMVIGVFTLGLIANSWAKELNIAFADKMKILFEYKKTKDLNQELEKESQEARTTVEKMSEDIKKLQDEMELLSESARKEKQPELEKKMQELENFRREKMQSIGKKQDEGIRQITKEIADICEQFGKGKGYDAILDIRASLYTPAGMDVTDGILAEMNKAQAPAAPAAQPAK